MTRKIHIDANDFVFYGGLTLLFVGLALQSNPLELIVVGSILAGVNNRNH